MTLLAKKMPVVTAGWVSVSQRQEDGPTDGELLLTLPRSDYVACVSRAEDRRFVEVYAVSLRQRLPRVAVPPRDPNPDVVLDLPTIFARCYDNGAYAARVDYNQPPPDPFRPDDEPWADRLLREAGLRTPPQSLNAS